MSRQQYKAVFAALGFAALAVLIIVVLINLRMPPEAIAPPTTGSNQQAIPGQASDHIPITANKNKIVHESDDLCKLDDEWLEEVRRKIEHSILYDNIYRITPDDLAPVNQPDGYNHLAIRVSPDDRYAAYLSGSSDTMAVIVIDQQTGAETVLPAPEGNLPEHRSIRQLAWSGDGRELFVVEDARHDEAFDPESVPQILYRWGPGEAQVSVLDRFDGMISSLATIGSDVYLTHQSSEKGWGHVDLKKYHGGRLASSQTLHISHHGNSIDSFRQQLLPGNSELWFITMQQEPSGGQKKWLAMMNLDAPGSEARLVTPDIGTFAWSTNEEKLVIATRTQRIREKDRLSFQVLRRDALDQPAVVLAKEVNANSGGLTIAGVSHDGQSLYLNSLTKEKTAYRDLFVPGNWRVYRYALSN